MAWWAVTLLRPTNLTKEELARAEADPKVTLKVAKTDLPQVKMRAKGPRYTPVSKRADKPDAIAYILKNNPELSDVTLKLVGTTKPTIQMLRDRTHPNASNIRLRHPADAGLCTYQEYEKAVNKGLKAAGKDPESKPSAPPPLDIPAVTDATDAGRRYRYRRVRFLDSAKKDQTKVPLDDDGTN